MNALRLMMAGLLGLAGTSAHGQDAPPSPQGAALDRKVADIAECRTSPWVGYWVIAPGGRTE